jgi:hypothetical protein
MEWCARKACSLTVGFSSFRIDLHLVNVSVVLSKKIKNLESRWVNGSYGGCSVHSLGTPRGNAVVEKDFDNRGWERCCSNGQWMDIIMAVKVGIPSMFEQPTQGDLAAWYASVLRLV